MAKPRKLTKEEQNLIVILADAPGPEPIQDLAGIFELSTEKALETLILLRKSLRIYRDRNFRISLAVDEDAINKPEIPINEIL